MRFKWARFGRGSTADREILRYCVNSPSIMVGKVSSIMHAEAGKVNGD
jgi:hypothetical protein